MSAERIAELSAQIDALDIERRKLAHERGVLRRRIARTGKKHTPESIEKIRAAMLGRKPSKASRKNMSQAHLERLRDPDVREEMVRAIQAGHQRRKGVNAVDPLEARIFGGARGR